MKTTNRTLRRMSIFIAIANFIQNQKKEGVDVKNMNNVYKRFGVNTGSPIYYPKRTKVKGYQRDNNGKVKKKR